MIRLTDWGICPIEVEAEAKEIKIAGQKMFVEYYLVEHQRR
jgi:hypothetical protein